MLRPVLVYYHLFLTLLVQCMFVLVREWLCAFTILGDMELPIDELMSTGVYQGLCICVRKSHNSPTKKSYSGYTVFPCVAIPFSPRKLIPHL